MLLLLLALLIGPRDRFVKKRVDYPFNLAMATLGSGLLWISNLAMNSGSALGSTPVAVRALLNTQMSCCAAVFTWFVCERSFTGNE